MCLGSAHLMVGACLCLAEAARHSDRGATGDALSLYMLVPDELLLETGRRAVECGSLESC
jgi:hypothetical protein